MLQPIEPFKKGLRKKIYPKKHNIMANRHIQE